jgi:hypothetical protein
VGLGTEDLGPEDRLVQVHLAVELLDDRRLGLQVDDRVDALGLLLDLVRETTFSTFPLASRTTERKFSISGETARSSRSGSRMTITS